MQLPCFQTGKALSFYHLKENIQDYAGAIFANRRSRFLMGMGMTAFLTLVYATQEYLEKSLDDSLDSDAMDPQDIVFDVLVALSILGSLLSCIKRNHFMEDIENHIREAGTLSSVINEEFLDEYPDLNQQKNFWFYVNGNSGIEYESHYPCTIRNKRLIILP